MYYDARTLTGERGRTGGDVSGSIRAQALAVEVKASNEGVVFVLQRSKRSYVSGVNWSVARLKRVHHHFHRTQAVGAPYLSAGLRAHFRACCPMAARCSAKLNSCTGRRSCSPACSLGCKSPPKRSNAKLWKGCHAVLSADGRLVSLVTVLTISEKTKSRSAGKTCGRCCSVACQLNVPSKVPKHS